MVLKGLFGRKKKPVRTEADKDLTIEDLITLERYEEALEQLKARVKMVPKDLHAHLRLAEVYVALKVVDKALDEYVFVADSQVEDGFYDKGVAVLSKAAKLAPGNDRLPRKIESYRKLKRLENRRQYAVKGLLNNKSTGTETAGNSTLEIELLWSKIAKSHLVEQLDGENLEKLFSVVEMIKTRDGQILADRGSDFPVMFLVVDGVIEAGVEVNGKSTTIRSFTTGDLIGDGALLERKSWPAEYKVTQPGTLFRLDREGLQLVMAGNADPVAFLSVLRQQHHDRDVAASLARLHAG